MRFVHALYRMLAGGDLRSIGKANEAVRAAIDDPSLADVLFAGISHPDPVVRMRCADALEKYSRQRPDYVQRRRRALRGLLEARQPKEVKWHLLQMIARSRWTAAERRDLLNAIMPCLDDPSILVRVSALQALHDLAGQGSPLREHAETQLRKALSSEHPSLRARAGRLLRAKDRA